MKYIKYRLLLQEPVRIADDSSAKQGQTMTQNYIPGSTIRGYVINKLSEKPFFSGIKKELFSDRVRFHNAYLTVVEESERVLLPSPKGFYEDKSETQFKNVVLDGDVDESMKRAKLGTNVYIELPHNGNANSSESGTIHFYSPQFVSGTKIKMGAGKDQKVFRSTSIQSGYRYTGYVALDNEDLPLNLEIGNGSVNSSRTLSDAVMTAIGKNVILGNARTSGLGKCTVEYCILTDEAPYASYMFDGEAVANGLSDGIQGEESGMTWAKAKSMMDESEDKDSSPRKEADGTEECKDCYMMLVSDTVMRNERGEYCGLDIPSLEKVLGVRELEIAYCATKVNDVRGFNRHYKGAIPSMPAYEKGSVFHFKYKGSLDKEHLDEVHRRGIGLRRNEGFGQVLFIKNYEDIGSKRKGGPIKRAGYAASEDGASTAADNDNVEHVEDKGVILIAAKRCYRNQIDSAMRRYVVNRENELKGTSDSQLGNILSIAIKNRFVPEAAWERINAYLDNKTQKEDRQRVHGTNERKSSDNLKNSIKKIENTPLHELLELKFTKTEKTVMGLQLNQLLSDTEEKRIGLELLIQMIRYAFKKEVAE